MIVKDTVLLPSLRYIVQMLDAGTDAAHIVSDLKDLCEYGFTEGTSHVIKTLKEIYLWFDSYAEDREKAKGQLEDVILRGTGCGECLKCYDCLRMFWIQVYHRLYDETAFKKLEGMLCGENTYVFRTLPPEIYRHLDARMSAADYYWEHCGSMKKIKKFNNRLIVLKGMSSSTPAMLNSAFNTQNFHGGGLYINWKGFGIVIDPGYHFVEAMHNTGLTVMDVNAVIITHEHIDHNNDMRILEDLNQSLARFTKEKDREHKISWYLDEATYSLVEGLQRTESGFNQKTNQIFELDPNAGQAFKQSGNGGGHVCWEERSIPSEGLLLYEQNRVKIFLRIAGTEHEKSHNKYLQHTFSVKLVFTEADMVRSVYYTSDTRYQKSVGNLAKDSDIVIANISSVYEEDILKAKPKETHLGYWGCYRLLEDMCKKPPSFFLVSEFWNGKTDIRFDIVKFLKEEAVKLCEEMRANTKIIPAEIGMQIDLEKLQIQCMICKRFSDKVITVKPAEEYGEIRCICDKCYII